MLAAAPVAAVAALLIAAASCADTQYNILPYKSVARKGLKSATMRELSPNYIPDNQCSGLITHLSCPPLAMKALQVVVLDREQYAEVHIEDSLAAAQVYRRAGPGGRCAGEAAVQVSLSCGGYRRMLASDPRRRRRRRALPAPRDLPAPRALPPVV